LNTKLKLYDGELDDAVIAGAVAALDGLTGNQNIPNPPVDPGVLKIAIEAYRAAIGSNGGLAATEQRNKCRNVVVSMLRQLGDWEDLQRQDSERSCESLAQECEDLFRKFSRLIRRSALRVTGNWHDAEDAVQTIFVKLLTHGISPELTANPKPYLRKAAFNEGLKIRQSQQRRGLVEQSEDEDFDCVDSSQSRFDADTRLRLKEAMAQLKPHERQVLVLQYWQGYSDQEIAARLGKSRCSVGMTLSRARARLKQLMS